MAETAFTEAENAALQAAMDKSTGKLFGGQSSGTSVLKLKAAAAGGPLAADAWDEVRADHDILGDKSDDALSAAFLALEAERIASKKTTATAPSPNDAVSGIAPLALAFAVAIAFTSTLGGGCDSAYANAAACAEKEQRAAGAVRETPLARYREMAIESSADNLKAWERAPMEGQPKPLSSADIQGMAANLGDADFWKGKKK